MFVNNPDFGKIVDFDRLREVLREVYDELYPDFNMLGSMRVGSRVFYDEPSYMIAGGASMLAYMLVLAAEEFEMAESLKDYIFTLGWTEEHTGTDLLSIRTQATPLSDAADERQFHVKGEKWLINNSFHADYHIVLAKIDPQQDGPRSLSLFLVPRSSIKSWDRLETHVLTNMVLTKFRIDGPGTLLGKRGHGLSIVQRMAMPSKYQCSYVGVQMLRQSIPATVEHLSTKKIFGDNPIAFGNVFRQMYNLSLQSALMQFLYYRAVAYSDSDFLQFHGTMLKSFLLLRANELLSQNWLVAGSKGFLKESVIGRNAIDSFVLPVFDGHYTLNTLMCVKHLPRYIGATRQENLSERVNFLRQNMFAEKLGSQIAAKPSDIRNPDFFDMADYIRQFDLPFDLNGYELLENINTLIEELSAVGVSSDVEYRYKMGNLLQWVESLVGACELWKVMDNDVYLNAIIQQYNGVANVYNAIISEGNLATPFMQPMRQLPLPEVSNPVEFLMALQDIQAHIPQAKAVQES